jgi:hypothetical protein
MIKQTGKQGFQEASLSCTVNRNKNEKDLHQNNFLPCHLQYDLYFFQFEPISDWVS